MPWGAARESGKNTMPFILGAVRAYATVGEICDAFRDVFDTYTYISVFPSLVHRRAPLTLATSEESKQAGGNKLAGPGSYSQRFGVLWDERRRRP